ncbi:SDR family NAD(P)-dependent oxidoreductase [Paraburkholderia dipogonis]|uniref:SDR family NAD(P)-dependent oxidoreductase n=1 Tax=Paraburkholderia dipogonis TaxID=1211383 RepID=UPI0038B9FAF9
MELNLKDRVAIVTGASIGMGAGVARRLAHEGMQFALVARDVEMLDATATALPESSGAHVLTMQPKSGRHGTKGQPIRRAVPHGQSIQ